MRAAASTQHFSRPSLLVFLGLSLTAAIFANLVVFDPGIASAHQGPIVVHGRGWGHGRGMGQYGAYGYASNYGWSSDRILDHFYGGTRAGQIPSSGQISPNALRVELRYVMGRPTDVGIAEGSIVVTAAGEETTYSQGAVRIKANSANSYTIYTSTDCGGQWAEHKTVQANKVWIKRAAGAAQQQLLQVCGPDYRTWFDGQVIAAYADGQQHTMNLVSVEEYLRGVVPNEMPASWPIEAIKSQAVAARSYVVAGDTRWLPYADTCDTTRCQVYDGRYTTKGGSFRQSTHATTDSAINQTRGLVRIHSDGTVARTEFSSSTGGHTTAWEFPAVEDKGDSISANPNHTWQKTLSFGYLESKYGLGHIQDITVLSRDGYGVDGGRVKELQYRFSKGSVTVSGTTAQSELGLKSDWFTIGPSQSKPAKTVTGETIRQDRRFIYEAYRRALRRGPTVQEVKAWESPEKRVNRSQVAATLARTKKFATPAVNRLYQQVHKRRPDTQGRDYWVAKLESGANLGQVTANFYGSEEYFKSRDRNNKFYVTSLYRKILKREPTPKAVKEWVRRIESGDATRSDVALSFVRSEESRRVRGAVIHRRVNRSQPSDAVAQDLAQRLTRVDDLTLAGELLAQL